jgi:hypothetical protein
MRRERPESMRNAIIRLGMDVTDGRMSRDAAIVSLMEAHPHLRRSEAATWIDGWHAALPEDRR